MTPTRPIMRYYGGKWRLASWVIQHFPPHRIYVEPFGGAGSVLLQKPRAFAEIWNDLDDEIVNVFRVLRDPAAALRLQELLRLTPFARVEFEAAYDPAVDPVERARRTLVKAFMGFGSNAIHASKPRGMRTAASTWQGPVERYNREPSGFCPVGGWGTKSSGFRPTNLGAEETYTVSFSPTKAKVHHTQAFSAKHPTRSGSTHATDWLRYPDLIPLFVARLAGVVIEHRLALDIIRQHDRADTLFYADPLYVHDTRNRRDRHGYTHEMSDDDHRSLAAALHQVRGMVVISGYPCPLYDELYGDWAQDRRASRADGAHARTEGLWLNPAAAAYGQMRLGLEAGR